jgi:hypothetical protein
MTDKEVLAEQREALKAAGLTDEQLVLAMQPLLCFYDQTREDPSSNTDPDAPCRVCGRPWWKCEH